MNQCFQNIIATLLLVLLSWQYSSPPLRLKEVPVLDSLSNGCIVFLAWFCGFSSFELGVSDIPAKGILLSLCTTGVHALGAVMDTEADLSSGQKTATHFGKGQRHFLPHRASGKSKSCRTFMTYPLQCCSLKNS